MAKTRAGKKIVPVKTHTRRAPGGKKKTIKIGGHRRSTPN